jgi:hypothetical protein
MPSLDPQNLPAKQVNDQLAKFMHTLRCRWEDEQEYEDIAEYRQAIVKACKVPGVTFGNMTKKPFEIHFTTFSGTRQAKHYSLRATLSSVTMYEHP